MCKCICSAANMHPFMKHLSMLREGLPPFFLIFLFFLLVCLLKGKITCLYFSPAVTGPSALALHHVYWIHSGISVCHFFCYEQIAQIVKSIHRSLAEGCIISTTWVILFYPFCIYLVFYISSDFCFSCQCAGELWKPRWERMRWQL